MSIKHKTITFKREFEATPEAFFSTYSDIGLREKWSAPSPTAEVKIDECDFRTGGWEKGRCGSKGDLRWNTKVIYHLVDPGQRISFTEELWEGEQLLTVALVTIVVRPKGNRTQLALTDQVTSFVGEGGISGHQTGYNQALDNLVSSLERAG